MKQVTLADNEPLARVTAQLPRSLKEKLEAEAERRSSAIRKVGISEVLRDLIDKGC